MYFALDENNNRVYIDDAKTKYDYFCPTCEQMLIIRKGKIRQHHFAHKATARCTDGWHYDMSQWHKEWQDRFPVECRERVLESNGKKHRADVLINNTVIEFQHSTLQPEEFQARNQFYTSLGYGVVWIFDCATEIYMTDSEREMYCWEKPNKGLRYYSKQDRHVLIFIQRDKRYIDEYNKEHEIELLRVNWVSDDGFQMFTSHEIITDLEFLERFGGNSLYRSLSRRDIFDKLVRLKNTKNENVFWGCPRSKTGVVSKEKCYACYRYHVGDGCKYRFRNEKFWSGINISKIQRNVEGCVKMIQINNNGWIKTRTYDERKRIGRTIPFLWREYQARAIIVRNLQTGTTVKIGQDVEWMIRKYGQCYGNIKELTDIFKSDRELINDWDKQLWVVEWYIKNDDEEI